MENTGGLRIFVGWVSGMQLSLVGNKDTFIGVEFVMRLFCGKNWVLLPVKRHTW